MFSKLTTLLLISRQTLARVDIVHGAKPKIVNHWQRARFESDSIATLVDATCRLGKRKPGKVVVLSDKFWMGVAALPDEIASSLGGEELSQSIALECESYSGISAFESRSTSIPLELDRSGERRWLVTQIANADIRACEESVEQCGGSLVGAAHPANPFLIEPMSGRLPKRSSSSSDPSWRSVQVWGTTVSLLSGSGNRLLDAIVQDGNLSQPRMLETVEEFLKGTADTLDNDSNRSRAISGIDNDFSASPSQLVCWVNQALADVPEDQVIRTADATGLMALAAAWGKALSGSAEVNGWIRLPKRPMSRERSIGLAVAGGVVALLGVAVHHWYLQQEIRSIEENIRVVSDRKKQISDDKKGADTLEKTLTASRDKLTALTSSNAQLADDIATAEALHTKQQSRWITLVDAIADSHLPHCWIQRIVASDESVIIHGYAVDTASALQLTSTLEPLVAAAGWRTAPAETHPENGKLISFSFALNSSAPTARPIASTGSVATVTASAAETQRSYNTGTGTRASRRRAAANANSTTAAKESGS